MTDPFELLTDRLGSIFGALKELDASTRHEHQQVLTRRLNVVVNRFAARDDLMLSCLWRPPADGEAPAWFDPTRNHITLNGHVGLKGAHPKDVNPLTAVGRRKHPEIIGLLAHEAAHAHSTASGPEVVAFKAALREENPLLLTAFTLLEEPRIEYRQVQRRPQDRYYLRAQSVLLDLSPFQLGKDQGALDRWRSATMALLVYGRLDAGILNSYDADLVQDALTDALGAEDLEELRDVQRDVIRVADGDLDALAECARRWLAVVQRPEDAALDADALLVSMGGVGAFGCGGEVPDGEGKPSEAAETPPATAEGAEGDEGGPAGDGDEDWANEAADEAAAEAASGGGEGESPDDSEGGEGSSGTPGVLSSLGEALKQLAETVAGDVEADAAAAAAAAAGAEEGTARRRKRQDESKQRVKEQELAVKTFDGEMNAKCKRPTKVKERPPTAEERQYAREVGLALKRSQVRDRTSVVFSSPTPPGRLNGRDAMLGDAQRSRGATVTARPFRATKKRHAPEPPIALGIMTDHSGSMTWAEEAMASISWILSHAMAHVTGTAASLTFRKRSVPLTKPGERPASVTTFRAGGGGENFRDAFAAMNGALSLTRGTGARLLVVVSDGQYEPIQTRAVEEAVLRMRRGGAHMLWVGLPGSLFPAGATAVVVHAEERSATRDTIIEAIVDALCEVLRKLK